MVVITRYMCLMMLVYSPMAYGLGGLQAAAQRQLDEHRVEIQEGTIRFRAMEHEGRSCRRWCAYTAPAIFAFVIVIYFLFQRHLHEEMTMITE